MKVIETNSHTAAIALAIATVETENRWVVLQGQKVAIFDPAEMAGLAGGPPDKFSNTPRSVLVRTLAVVLAETDGAKFDDASDIVASDLALASWLGQHSTPADKVVVWDSPLANALSGRKPPTRIGFFFPLVSPVITGSALEPGPLQQRMRAEYLGGLDDPATRYVAVTADALAGREPQPRKSIPMLFPEFGERLTRSWTVVDSAAGYLVFARQAQ